MREISALVQNPTVAYRLDPGEPGVANPARATNSAYTVVAQESRNRARLQSQALLAGDQVLLVKTDYKVEKVGSFLVIVGGLTTVVSRASRPEADLPSPLEQAQPTSEDANPQERAERVSELRAEQERLETDLRELERASRSGNPFVAAQAEFRLTDIEHRLREVTSELARFGVPSDAAAMVPSVALGANALNMTLETPGRLLDLLA